MQYEPIKLYNTLKLVETRGDSTVTMADCLRFLGQLIEKSKEKKKTNQLIIKRRKQLWILQL